MPTLDQQYWGVHGGRRGRPSGAPPPLPPNTARAPAKALRTTTLARAAAPVVHPPPCPPPSNFPSGNSSSGSSSRHIMQGGIRGRGGCRPRTPHYGTSRSVARPTPTCAPQRPRGKGCGRRGIVSRPGAPPWSANPASPRRRAAVPSLPQQWHQRGRPQLPPGRGRGGGWSEPCGHLLSFVGCPHLVCVRSGGPRAHFCPGLQREVAAFASCPSGHAGGHSPGHWGASGRSHHG